MPLKVLYEDNHLLVVAKPVGLPTQGALADRESLVKQAKEYLRQKYGKPGNVYLGVVSRLDSPVSGVVVFARTSKAAARLNEQFRNRTVEKIYWALVEGRVEPAEAECVDWLKKDERQQRMEVVRKPVGGENKASEKRTGGAVQARLKYKRLKVSSKSSLLEISLETGRKHQIRVQLAARHHPIVGDAKYGSQRKFAGGIALHCRRLVIEHPIKKTPLELTAPPPKTWKEFTT
jgi:23S rRNA pseudouridine1911/1915/1917 synthase